MNHGLEEGTLTEIHRVLAQYPAVERAVLYGSRAKGGHRPGSDVDLALAGRELDRSTVSRVADDFEDGPLPYRFDLSILEETQSAALLDHISRVGLVFYQR